MAKLVDALCSGRSAARCAGSNPVLGTKKLKPASSAGFGHYSKYSPKSALMKFRDFKPPRTVKGPKWWYIEYYTRITVEAKEAYGNKEWLRVKVFSNLRGFQHGG